jgi:RHS repeat-associated protein
MSSRAGGAISSYSYNLPNQINYNGNSAQFSYTADHQRWKQVASYTGVTETTHYIGGVFEVLTRGSHVEYRHLIPAGSSQAVFTRRSDCSTNTYYLTSDHLGSADLVLDNYGTVLTKESFSAFGARRGSNWQGVPTTADYSTFASTSRTGFTGHEMLDSVSLVHMGGRVYDPYLGRFLSADSLVQSLGVTQSVNPYSYAWNDPLRYTDPYGHSLIGDIIGAIVAIVAVGRLHQSIQRPARCGPQRAHLWRRRPLDLEIHRLPRADRDHLYLLPRQERCHHVRCRA